MLEPRRAQSAAQRREEKPFLALATGVAEKVTGTTLPKWNHSVPYPTKNLGVPAHRRAFRGGVRALRGEKEFIYFPSCISRQLGTPNLAERNDEHSEEHSRSVSNSETDFVTGPSTAASTSLHSAQRPLRANISLAETLITVARRANINLAIPEDSEGVCCGMPFSSKGYTAAYKQTLHKAIAKFWAWSEGGKYPIVIDTTSCAHTLRGCQDPSTGFRQVQPGSSGQVLSPEDLALYRQMTLLDSIEFIHDSLLPRLELHPVEEDVVLHPNCSARKLGLDGKLLSIAQKCARSATVPLNLGCCAFAGDRGLLYPELTASATEKEAAEVLSRDYDGYYSSNITCEMGMSEATGKDYVGIVYLVEKASRTE
jgi:hypothetical protein